MYAGRGTRAVFVSRLLRPDPFPTEPVGLAAPAFRPIGRGRGVLSRAIHTQPGPTAFIGLAAPAFRPVGRGRGVFARAIHYLAGVTRASVPVVASFEADGHSDVHFTASLEAVLITDVGPGGLYLGEDANIGDRQITVVGRRFFAGGFGIAVVTEENDYQHRERMWVAAGGLGNRWTLTRGIEVSGDRYHRKGDRVFAVLGVLELIDSISADDRQITTNGPGPALFAFRVLIGTELLRITWGGTITFTNEDGDLRSIWNVARAVGGTRAHAQRAHSIIYIVQDDDPPPCLGPGETAQNYIF